MSLKLIILFSFLLVQLTYGQYTINLVVNDTELETTETIIADTELPSENLLDNELLPANQTLSDDSYNQIVSTNTVKPHPSKVKSPGWSYFFPSKGFLNGFPVRLLKSDPDLSKLGLILITRVHCNRVSELHVCKYTQTRFGVNETKALLRDSNFDINRKTVIYFHGFEDSIDSDATHLLIDAYLKRDDHNLFICDYGELLGNKYLKTAVANIEAMAPAVAQLIYTMNSKGFNIALLHLVGHSLGAQMAGSIGKAYMELTDGTKLIKRITGLDPSFVFFYPPIGRHITAQDAEFVDIIHTDAWGYGAPVSTGQIDFWPNGGSYKQPGCPQKEYKISSTKVDTCSHYRAIRFWAESLETQNGFLALKCSSWYKFKKNDCQPKMTNCMGYDAQPDVPGNYFLQTNDVSPFTRKHHGIIYDNIE